MKHRVSFLTLLTALAPAFLTAQGWQFAGPDSTNWRDVSRVSVKWLSPASSRLAATTGRGVGLTYPGGSWEYFTNTNPNPAFPGRTYTYSEFSPWADTLYLGIVETENLEPYCQLMMLGLSGQAWQPVNPMGCWATPFSVIHGSDLRTVFATGCGLFRSTNGGNSWVTLDSNQASYRSKVLAVDNASTSIVFRAGINEYASNLNTIFRSADQGTTWDSIFSLQPSPPYGNYPLEVLAQGDSILVGVHSSETDTSHVYGIYRSTDGAETWSRVYIRGRVVGIVKSNVTPNTLFAASEEGILKSADFGATWSPYNNALPTTHLTSLAIGPYSDTMFVSTSTHGVLKVWNYLTEISEDKGFPGEAILEQNYPNPFNPRTEVRFRISDLGCVSLKVYDLLGREVATLVNEGLRPGQYQKTFDASGLSGGVYFCRLQAGSFVDTKKLLLVR